jgi:beta-galactosidase
MMSERPFSFGADYYPEQWPEARWPEDARLMKEAGFNVVRLAEFAWGKMETEEGRFDFAWLDRAIDILAASGMQVVLGTPTASPPPWLMAKGEDLFLVEATGLRRPYGLRREYCPSHPLYREHAARIVERMGLHFCDHPAVIGWQIDNELGDRCYCSLCRRGFQDWLKKRYGSLEALNQAWGTTFWSHTYTDWRQVPVPLATVPLHNPGLALDYRRFMSDVYCEYLRLQRDVLRRRCPGHFITHNLMGFGYGQLNYYDLAADLDHVSWDIYPRHQWDMKAEVDPARAALSGDTMRGLKKMNYWVMEQQSGSGGWDMLAVTPKPGELRLWTYQSIAHGADGILYFRWRTARFGAEQHWLGILDADGTPSRRYGEVSRIGRELQRIGARIAGSQVRSKVAIVQSFDSRFAFQGQANHPQFGYESHLQDVYRGFFNHHIPVDIISESDDLAGYTVVVAPALYILTARTAARLGEFAQRGGIVVFTPRTGAKDESNASIDRKLPGLVAQMCGIEIEECVSMPVDQGNRVRFCLTELSGTFPTYALADVIDPKGAKVIAEHVEDFYAGRPAATIHAYGEGQVVYLGVVGDHEFWAAVTSWISRLAEVEPVLQAPVGVEVAERWRGGQRVVLALNHTNRAQVIHVPDGYTILFEAEAVGRELRIEPYGVVVLSPQADGGGP